MSSGAFAGVKVLDLSRVLAGPYCGQLLADFGADVIKVEAPEGDENRHWEPLIDGQSANFLSVNRGKRALTLNLKTPRGQDLLRSLVARSDVLIESFPPATAERLGLGHARLHEINQDLVHVSVTGYGQCGPLRDAPGYDLTLQAFTGMMAMTGEPGGAPVRAGASFIDMSTGIAAFSAVSAALYARRAGNARGQHVTVSLLETAVALLGYHAVAHTALGIVPPRSGSGVWHLVPYQAFETADGWVLVGAANDAAWQRLCGALGRPDLAVDPRFTAGVDRIRHKSALLAQLEPVMRTATTSQWMARLQPARVACAPIQDLAAALAHEQVAATQMVLGPAAGVARGLVGSPIKMTGTPPRFGCAPPRLGQDSAQVLHEELGLTAGEVRRLQEEGVL